MTRELSVRATCNVRRYVLAASILVVTPGALGWVYPEHRHAAILAVEALEPGQRATFERLWQASRTGNEARLCASGADTSPERCIDWVALPAIAGDHACSSSEMLDTVLNSEWVLQIADIAAVLAADLEEIPVTAPANQASSPGERRAIERTRANRLNSLRVADSRMQRADLEYAIRAGANNAHFLLARPDVGTDVDSYVRLTLDDGAELSAIGVYASYHLSALQKASRLRSESLSQSEYAQLATAVLFDEAFALHFLEDAYASGHVAGTWGNASQRKGTHDHYNQNGLEVTNWQGDRRIVLMGDAHMRDQDAQLVAAAVAASLGQVLDIASGADTQKSVPYTAAAASEPDGFDVCANETLPLRDASLQFTDAYRPNFAETLLPTPVPSLGAGLGSMPRFRSEMGTFVGLAGAVDARALSNGFLETQNTSGGVAGLDLSFRAGIGLEGVLGSSGDGLVFAAVGLRSDSPSSMDFAEDLDVDVGRVSAALPARSAISGRFRMPFYVVPGDLLILAPMYFLDRDTYTKMAVTASNGGLIPWQLGWATSIGRFQFVLGRELGITWFGALEDERVFGLSESGDEIEIVSLRSTYFELPILEYRPYRAFSMNQSSTVLLQFFAGVDIPRGGTVDTPRDAPRAELQKIWSLGVRMSFDWRYYF